MKNFFNFLLHNNKVYKTQEIVAYIFLVILSVVIVEPITSLYYSIKAEQNPLMKYSFWRFIDTYYFLIIGIALSVSVFSILISIYRKNYWSDRCAVAEEKFHESVRGLNRLFSLSKTTNSNKKIPHELDQQVQGFVKDRLKEQWGVNKVDDPVSARLIVVDGESVLMNAHKLHPKNGTPFYVAVQIFDINHPN